MHGRSIADRSRITPRTPVVDRELRQRLGALEGELFIAVLIARAANADPADHLAGSPKCPASVERRQIGVGPVSHGPPIVQDLQSPQGSVAADEGRRIGLPLSGANVDRGGAILPVEVHHLATAVHDGDRERGIIRACCLEHRVHGQASACQADVQLFDHASRPIADRPMRASASSRLVVFPLMAMPPTTWPLARMATPPCSVVSIGSPQSSSVRSRALTWLSLNSTVSRPSIAAV